MDGKPFLIAVAKRPANEYFRALPHQLALLCWQAMSLLAASFIQQISAIPGFAPHNSKACAGA